MISKRIFIKRSEDIQHAQHVQSCIQVRNEHTRKGFIIGTRKRFLGQQLYMNNIRDNRRRMSVGKYQNITYFEVEIRIEM